MRNSLFSFFLFIFSLNSLSPSLFAYPNKGGYVKYSTTNDAFFQTDRDYTTGIRFEWVPARSRSLFHLGIDLFTPDDLSAGAQPPGQHPYAAHAHLGFSYDFRTSRRMAYLMGIKFGLVGPRVKGEQIQNKFHKQIGANRAYGWQNQIFNQYTHRLHLQPQYSLPLPFSRLIFSLPMQWGNEKKAAGLSVEIRIGKKLPHFQTHLFRHRSHYIFVEVERKYIFQDIFLEGNSKREGEQVIQSYHVEPLSPVNYLRGGLHIGFKAFFIRLKAARISRQFKTQASTYNRHGTFSLGVHY